jgi:hypothetical protein
MGRFGPGLNNGTLNAVQSTMLDILRPGNQGPVAFALRWMENYNTCFAVG